MGAILGTQGDASDSAIWEGLRFGTEDVRVSAGGAPARVVMQDGGMTWLQVRQGPLLKWGGYALLGTIALLALFYLIRGRIRVAHGLSGRTITRFNFLERFGHWLLAGSFILLGFTGLITLFGRKGLIPWMGHDAYAVLAHGSKLIHNSVSWAFMLALVWVFVAWVAHNMPSRTDLVWFAKGGGIIGRAHPPARKFNAGQKLVFWAVILLGASVSASGLSLLFPFDLPMFAKTFVHLNDWGITGLVGLDPLPTQLAPQEEMQYAQLWHAIVAFAMMCVILAHIYIGTIGMQGAYAAMGSGEVDLNWAKEHHSLWVEEVEGGAASPKRPAPAE
jgi:formate dehydrogenase subunit gamma